MTELDARPATTHKVPRQDRNNQPPSERLSSYQPADRFRPGARPVVLTGAQAIGRLLTEQHVRDLDAGLRTASFVSGYPGSPLAGIEKVIKSIPSYQSEHGIHFQHGVNEELAATAVWGSQQQLPGSTRTVDGVVGVWFGKGPGVDRSADALRHANLYGVDPRGGAVLFAGDDPASKSSSVPCVSERTLASLHIPTFYPRNAAEVVRYGLHAIALSRASGCWIAVKITSDVADGLFTVDEDFGTPPIIPEIEWDGKPWAYQQHVLANPVESVIPEADLFGPRHAMIEAYQEANHLDTVDFDSPNARIGIVASGIQFDAVHEALADLGLDDAALRRAGVRMLRVAMPWPLAAEPIRRFAEGLEEILVVEEKTSFIEAQIKEILYGRADAPVVLGKHDRERRALVPAGGQLTADLLKPALRRVFAEFVPAPLAPATASLIGQRLPLATNRIPYYCSGCPHNRSTVVPEGSLAAGGIGCHTMVTIAPRATSQVVGLTQMGGEGGLWVGQSPFVTDVDHMFQNLGDGTYFHSGQLALQQAIAAGVNITYKILYNDVIAMTGAQQPQGQIGVPALTRKLAAEGIHTMIVLAEDPAKYARGANLAPGVKVWHRDRLDEAQKVLRDTKGVTVLIYDQHCAADARRLRKRGELPTKQTKVIINEAVCEGCGDCGVKSNCLSVQPIHTEFGRKTRIDQTTCNTDYTCLQGDCPSFITVQAPDPKDAKSAAAATGKAAFQTPPKLADVAPAKIHGEYNIFLAGIGGTGIVTVNSILAHAALLDGISASGLDQTGLSQKAGAVTSHLRLTTTATETANRIGATDADLILAFDLMVAANSQNLALAAPARTTVIASTSETPTGEMVYDPSVAYPAEDDLAGRLQEVSHRFEAFDMISCAEQLLGSAESANLMLVGAAIQAGVLPISIESVRRAIEMNKVAVKANLAALEWGRVAIADPATFAQASAKPGARVPDGSAYLTDSPLQGETRRATSIRAAGVAAHTDAKAARRYVGIVDQAWAAEQAITGSSAYATAVARGAHHLIAYKDEYEVARLLIDPDQEAAVLAQVPGASKVEYNLHPPMLKALGMNSKIRFGKVGRPALVALAKMKRVRGTKADPFGATRIRRLERALIVDYLDLIAELDRTLTADNLAVATELAELPEIIRGYEDVKLRNVAAYIARRAELGHPVSAEVAELAGRSEH
nr:indolepyruvate ferredoxin oxidoreductase family protein [Granulicoccus phenolivorans]